MTRWRRILLGLGNLSLCAAAHAGAAPIVAYTDIASGPTRGGENDKGIFLSVFGKHFGPAAGLGKSTRVFIGGKEVAEYRSQRPSRARPDITQITVQIGALAGARHGVPLPVEVKVDGQASNSDVTFTVNPGDIYFVSRDGDDERGRANDAERPFRTVQRAGINNNRAAEPGCATRDGDQAVRDAGVWGIVQPGDFIVMRAGTWTEAARDNFFLRVQNKSGTAPRGTPGTGPITVMGYPGERVAIERANTAGDGEPGGGISAADTARQTLGCGAWVTIVNLSVETGLSSGPVNTQAAWKNPSGSFWRVVDNELSAAGCVRNARCRAGGIAGSGLGNIWIGNHIHDVDDRPDCCTMFENHGVYIEAEGSYEIAFNLIEDIRGGNGIQTYLSGGSSQIGGVRIHHNLIRNVGKHGINLADGSADGIAVFSNIVHGADQASLRLNSRQLRGLRVLHNTFVLADRGRRGAPRAAIMNDAALDAGAIDFFNNVVVSGGADRRLLGGSVGLGNPARIDDNLWHGGSDRPSGTRQRLAAPRLASVAPDAESHIPLAGSPALHADRPWPSDLLPDRDYFFNPLPRSRTADLGAVWLTR